MPKSKEQKQKEAIERARKNIVKERALMLRCQPGGDLYIYQRNMFSVHDADDYARAALHNFRIKCAAAKVDTHGNPI
ncbi:hypothetical protein [Flavobacterium sp.]|jgi:hypothetical protein|uniref:hypothetical protein n=1 Tax=Flavobacterium sp. TaxID=239 RepID=UPI0037BFAC0E